MKPIAVALAVSLAGLSSFVSEAELSPLSAAPAPSASAVVPASISRLSKWEKLVARLDNEPASVQIREVNRFFNKIDFKSDYAAWGKKDYWATPNEFLSLGSGDCEDYAIAKYVSLRRLGVSDEQLRLVYVRALELNQAHMVLMVEMSDGEQVILDNLTGRVDPAADRKDLLPVYSFNSTGLWLLDKTYKERRIGNAERLPHWRAIQKKPDSSYIWQ